MTSQAAATELAVRDETSATMLTNRQLQYIANTSFVPAAFRGKLPEILAAVATGRALGIPDMNALRSIHIIDGKATFSAELMVQLVRKAGHSITGEVTGDQAIARGRRKDNGDEMTCTWTMEMADRAGLLKKQNWKSYPEAMLWSRAVSQLCRMLFADCFAGATYTPEEGEQTADELLDEATTSAPVVHDAEPDLEHVDATVEPDDQDDEVRVPGGFAAVGKTLAEVAASDGGADWLRWASEHEEKFDQAFNEALAVFLAEHEQGQLEVGA